MTGLARVRRIVLWALLWFVAACVVVFLFKRPERFADLITKLFEGVAHAVDAVVAMLERISRD